MATLTISYFASVDKEVAGIPIKSESVTTSGTSAATADVPTNAAVALIWSEDAHYVTFGDGTPTAAAGNSFYLPAGNSQWIRTFVAAGQSKKIAAITA